MENKLADRYTEMPYEQASSNMFRKMETDSRLEAERERRVADLNASIDYILDNLSSEERPSNKQVRDWISMLGTKMYRCQSIGVAPSKLADAYNIRNNLTVLLKATSSDQPK